jgi:hypothetical protein
MNETPAEKQKKILTDGQIDRQIDKNKQYIFENH